jgi:hypothetical protein
MKMINNYLDNFENYLPEDSRKEIREEFEASLLDQIEDQESQLERPLNQQEQQQLLLKIGHPMKVAAGFLSNQQLIGADYFPAYKKVLTFAFWIYAAITILKMLPFNISLVDGSFITTPIIIFWALVETGVWVFASVTVIFYLLEKYQTNIDFLYAWSPKQLSSSGKKLSLSRVETGFEILFIALFLSWWNSLFGDGAFFVGTEFTNAVTMSESMSSMQWPVNIIGGFSIAVSLYNLVNAGWDRNSLIVNLLIGIADLVVISIMMQFDQYAIFDSSLESGRFIEEFVNNIGLNIRITLSVIAVFVIWDLFSSIRKLK